MDFFSGLLPPTRKAQWPSPPISIDGDNAEAWADHKERCKSIISRVVTIVKQIDFLFKKAIEEKVKRRSNNPDVDSGTTAADGLYIQLGDEALDREIEKLLEARDRELREMREDIEESFDQFLDETDQNLSL